MDAATRLLGKDDLMALVETGRELASEIQLESLLPRILDRATALTESSAGSVLLFDEKRKALYFAHAIGPDAGVVLEKWGENSDQGVPLHKSKAGEVFTSGVSLIENRISKDPNHFKGVDRDTGTHTQSMVCVPMAVMGKRIGTMQIINKQKGVYSKRDLALLEHFAAQAAVAIRNARLFEDLLAHMGLYASRPKGIGPVELLDELSQPARSEDLSVLFADMRGFTQLCHVIQRPERTQAILNEFLGALADVVVARGGIVNKFLGDGLMALFRHGDHPARAVQSALDMVAGFQGLRAGWNEQNNESLDFLSLGIGITTDSVILGTIGSSRVRDFTGVGTTVNLAAYLVDKARGDRGILIDKRTYLAAKHLIQAFDGPVPFDFKKTGQTVGHPYEYYSVKSPSGASARELSPAGGRQTPDVATRNGVFISYSHEDKCWLELLKDHLQPYVRTGEIRVWDDAAIVPGDRWRDEIEQALTSVSVAVLLVSRSFFASKFITRTELPLFLAREKKKELRILWVPVSASSFEKTEVEPFQALIPPSRPLDSLSEGDRNQALVQACRGMYDAVTKRLNER